MNRNKCLKTSVWVELISLMSFISLTDHVFNNIPTYWIGVFLFSWFSAIQQSRHVCCLVCSFRNNWSSAPHANINKCVFAQADPEGGGHVDLRVTGSPSPFCSCCADVISHAGGELASCDLSEVGALLRMFYLNQSDTKCFAQILTASVCRAASWCHSS